MSAKGVVQFTPKQQEFVRQYIIDFNAQGAAIRAGYAKPGAGVTAFRLLRKPKIRDEVKRLVGERAVKSEIKAERVLQELARLAFVDIRKAFDEDGQLKPVNQIDDDTAPAIQGFDIEEHWVGRDQDEDKVLMRTKKVRFSNKLNALETCMKHLGIAGATELKFNLDNLSDDQLKQLRTLVSALTGSTGR